jgi:hypothetical protein
VTFLTEYLPQPEPNSSSTQRRGVKLLSTCPKTFKLVSGDLLPPFTVCGEVIYFWWYCPACRDWHVKTSPLPSVYLSENEAERYIPVDIPSNIPFEG